MFGKMLVKLFAIVVILVALLLPAAPQAAKADGFSTVHLIVDSVKVVNATTRGIHLDVTYLGADDCFTPHYVVTYHRWVTLATLTLPKEQAETLWQKPGGIRACDWGQYHANVFFGGPFETGKMTARVCDDTHCLSIRIKITEPKGKKNR